MVWYVLSCVQCATLLRCMGRVQKLTRDIDAVAVESVEAQRADTAPVRIDVK